MYGYIYLTTNLTNEKKYIGQRTWSENIEDDLYLGSGKILKSAISKYGEDCFNKEILCVCNSKDELNKKEIYYIELYNAVKDNMFYNIHSGGNGGNTRAGYTDEEMIAFKNMMKTARKGYSHSDETKEKIKAKARRGDHNHMRDTKYREFFSAMYSGEKNPMYGRKMSDEQKRILLESHNGKFNYNKGKVMSDEQKEKIATSLKARWQNKENREKWIQSRIGSKRSEETKAKQSKSAYARYGSFPLDVAVIIAKNSNGDVVYTFNGINEYLKFYNNTTYRNLRDAIKTSRTFKGLYWSVDFSSQSTIENIDKEEIHINK